jgi:hypothetical protein
LTVSNGGMRRFPGSVYVGIELEVNQRIVLSTDARWVAVRRALVVSLRAACASLSVPK